MELKLKANLLDIGTGGPLVVLLDDDTAKKIDVFVGDRVKIKAGKKSTICTVDLAESEPQDTVGIFRETARVLKIRKGQNVKVSPVSRPKSIQFIKQKLDNQKLNYEQINQIVNDIADNKLLSIETAYFVAGAYTHGFSSEETYYLTRSMVESGDTLKWKGTAVSKHCIGGISGNRTTMLIVPIVAAAGVLMPKTSSRSITSPAGTADTMEVLAPVKVKDINDMRKKAKKAGACIVWGGALNLAPADDKIIRAEHPLSLDPTPMLLASILAKKKSEGSDKVLIDIPVGKHSKVSTSKRYRELRRKFVRLGKKLGIDVQVMKSQGTEPIGKGVGPVLEARDVLWVLKRDERAPKDLEAKSVKMAGILLKLAGKARTKRGGAKLARELLESGKAYERMKKIIKTQGGKPNVDPDELNLGKQKYTYKAKRAGTVAGVNDDAVAEMAKLAGAPKDKEAGVYLEVSRGDKTARGDAVFTIYSDSKYRLGQAKKLAKEVVRFK